jgi:putative transposase
MNAIALERELPFAINVDHGTEVTSRALDEWCYLREAKLGSIRPGKPPEDGFVESFNLRPRDEYLNVIEFSRFGQARTVWDTGRHDCLHRRMHGSMAHLTPNEVASITSETGQEAAQL